MKNRKVSGKRKRWRERRLGLVRSWPFISSAPLRWGRVIRDFLKASEEAKVRWVNKFLVNHQIVVVHTVGLSVHNVKCLHVVFLQRGFSRWSIASNGIWRASIID